MITRSHGQRNLFETVIGPLEKLVEGLVEPALARLDQLLADERLMEAVAVRMAKRRPRSRTHGRPGTPVEVALRMLVLKRLRGWSFEETEREVRASLVYRQLVRVYFEKVPDAKTLLRLSAVIGSEGVAAIHDRLLEIAREQKLIAGRRARVDTTVVETDIRYPTDSRLLADGVRVLGGRSSALNKRPAWSAQNCATGCVPPPIGCWRFRGRRAAAVRTRGSGWNEGIAGSWRRCAARCAMPSGSVRSFCPELARCSANARGWWRRARTRNLSTFCRWYGG